MPAIYENFGVRFLYPENWSVLDEETEDWPRTVTVQSRQTAFWTIHVLPPGYEPQEMIDQLISSVRETYGETEVLAADELYGDTFTEGFDLAFFYLDLLVEAKIRHLETPSGTLIWHYQAESREFEALEAVLQAITVSLLATQVAAP
jgi:hypothetical protein